ncbi:hypothetical protein F441_13481 [Phytophthora nicotianae CJ01A1]|uniref:Calponin-homology (CH) domain-containing protein n=6 Tax=Phytophthora nicotianae TaxID=4792 RepID=W2R5J5_PHYN3|nr:hypothetical protein PPTG_03516 [Phytophthora nicotianae INRA-310]ETI41217.1 hypothetical protein F443_13546 [Phytophthora nicotianae P1569]ETK81261.1 hypothetical protein L915_13232 [Phytophthora nicotianae]ETO69876.1 hypothetical protein F444_13601 [Phytophthora nicotianae P1976]ETP10985.1 hypothetical protein F441_13481 [Phytophthora nicotianae CJ01A1]ETP39104.1 hypothetical protein F442_13406 [Phytophthora nicotianae P10297]KUF89509.1 Microtubule-associated protein RP/EB family member 
MIGAYFVSRTELLAWLNALCAMELTSVKQTSSGAVVCQVLDVLYPGKIPMNRVDWTATQPHECVHNYKLLQRIFLSLQIDKKIPVDKLIHGKYQDNLEFLQWLKAFYDRHEPPLQPYDAHARRAKGKGGVQYNQKLKGALVKKKARAATPNRHCSAEVKDAEVAAVLEKMKDMKIKSDGLIEEKQALEVELHALREKTERIKDERDFYLNKLETIAELVHNAELSKSTSAQTNLLGLSILDVLFATEEDEEENELPF